MRIRAFVLPLFLAGLATACGQATPPTDTTNLPGRVVPADDPATRPYLLERVGDAAIVQVYADGFASLTLPQKQLAYHLYRAAIAGRDIFYDQKHRMALEMRELIEAIVQRPGKVDRDTLAAVTEYTKLFWLNSGPYDMLTSRKFVLRSTPAAFKAAWLSTGARINLQPGETIDAHFARLDPMFFDPAFEPVLTAKNPPPGKDILTGSANNLYNGVSLADLAGFTEKFPFNSRLIKNPEGRLVEQVHGPDKLYFRQIRNVITHLTNAAAVAPEPTARALRALIHWYQSGEAADKTAYDIAWVEDKAAVVDTINGPTETYLDARNIKGAWEAGVYYVNRQKTDRIRTLAANAQWFEDHMPWDAKYRKTGVTGIVAAAMDVVVETGDAGPITFIGVNLPNDQTVREQHGSKSFSLANVNEAYDRSSPTGLRSEFSWSKEEADRAATWSTLSGDLITDMHEVIGHASGRLSPALKTGNPADVLKEIYGTIEEARADMVGLYFIADPRLAELGIFAAADQPAIAQAEYEAYARNGMVQLRRVGTDATIADTHLRNRQMVVHWLMANTKAIERRTREGKTYFVMVDAAAFRAGIGKLLAEVQRIKSEGDYAAGKALVETYGTKVDTALRDEVVARAKAVNPPTYSGFVMPKLTPVTAPDGTVIDVRISYPKNFTAQMLEYSGAQ